MRTSREEKARTHERIVAVAAERIRTDGLERPGVAEIMQAAGLTHGGFYKHFGSRDELVAEALEEALARGDQKLHELTDAAEDPLAAFAAWYLSDEHRDAPGAGCAVAALGGEVGRGDARLRAAYRDQAERYFEALERFLGADEGDRERAIMAVSALVGAVVMARAVDDEALSDEILAAVAKGVAGHGD